MGGKGSGGLRPGAGRPPSKAVQLQEAKTLVRELQQLVKTGLTKAALRLDDLIEEELRTAFEDESPALRQKARHYIMDILFRSVRLVDASEDHPLLRAMDKWNVRGDVHIGTNVAGENQRPPVDVEYRVIT